MASVSRELVLNYLKQHFGQEFTKQDLVEALGLSMAAVNGVINGLVRRECVTERIETVEVEPATETRKAKMKDIRHIMLTEKGLAYDPVAEEEAAKEAKAAERAAKKAAKEAAKAQAE